MWIVARATPQAIPTLPFTGTLVQLFEVAVGSRDGWACAGPDEVSEMVGQQRSGPERFILRLGARDPRRSRQMALRADAVAPCRIKLHRVDDFGRTVTVARGHFGDVVLARPMAPLATNAALAKGRVAETILRSGDRLKPAGVAFQASGAHRPGEMDELML